MTVSVRLSAVSAASAPRSDHVTSSKSDAQE